MILSFWICHGQRRTDRILLLLQIIFSGEDDYPTEKEYDGRKDYIFQNFLRDLDKKSLHSENGAVWKVISDEFRSEQALEVRSVMKAYYSAFNRQHYDDLGMISTTVLRKFNRQWRILLHHAVKMKASTYSGDLVPAKLNSQITNKRIRNLKKYA
eukprot:gene28867-32301_t